MTDIEIVRNAVRYTSSGAGAYDYYGALNRIERVYDTAREILEEMEHVSEVPTTLGGRSAATELRSWRTRLREALDG